MSSQKHILLLVCGGIAAYKSLELLRAFSRAGYDVRVVMTKAAEEFICPRSFAVLSGHPVADELFVPTSFSAPLGAELKENSGLGAALQTSQEDMPQTAPQAFLQTAGKALRQSTPHNSPQPAHQAAQQADPRDLPGTSRAQGASGFIPHIELSDWADAIVVCPASANILAKAALGSADDLASTLLLSAKTPVIFAPAMNSRMLMHPATQHNIDTLRQRGQLFVDPVTGKLACNAQGAGKLASVSAIFESVQNFLNEAEPQKSSSALRDLEGKRILITAGPTHESIDPVRYLANASSGKMGCALARRARARGAAVELVLGPVSIEPPHTARLQRVVSAQEMHAAAKTAFKHADAAICCAAVADYRPEKSFSHKLKKTTEPLDCIKLVKNPDILAELAQEAQGRPVIGFAAETEKLLKHAQEKLSTKGCSFIVANDISKKNSGFGSSSSEASLVFPDKTIALGCLPKEQLADRILDELVKLFKNDAESEPCSYKA